jgi:hypothetical protein
MYHLSLLPLDTFLNAWLYEFGKAPDTKIEKSVE